MPLSPFLSGGKRNRKSIATLAGRIGRLCEPLMPEEEARRSDQTEPAVPRMPQEAVWGSAARGKPLSGRPAELVPRHPENRRVLLRHVVPDRPELVGAEVDEHARQHLYELDETLVDAVGAP